MSDDLAVFIRDRLASMERLTVDAAPVHPPRSPDRAWKAAPSAVGAARVEWVRPELAELFPDARVEGRPRSPRSRSRGWQTRTYSHVAGRVVRGDSYLESQHVVDADLDGDVSFICEHPMCLVIPGGCRHQPDAFIRLASGEVEIREVKYEEEACRDEDKWKAFGTAIAAAGFGYRVVTELRLRHPPRLDNAALFMRDRHAEPPGEEVLDAIWSYLGDGKTTAADLSGAFLLLERKRLHALVRMGFIAVEDLDQPFGDASLLRRRRRRIRRVAAAFRNDCSPDPQCNPSLWSTEP